jgi:CRP-like cAMP-binding protein
MLVYEQGTVSDVFYLLVCGRVRISISRPDGSERLLSLVEPGATFGESSCFDGLPYYASARAMERSTVRIFAREDVLGAATKDPAISLDIFRALTRKQRLLAVQSAAVRLRSKDRLLMMLDHLVEAYGVPAAGGMVRLPIRLSTEELGSLIGVTRVTLSRDLSALVREGVVKKDGRELLVRRPVSGLYQMR